MSTLHECFQKLGTLSLYRTDVLLLDSTEAMRLFQKEQYLKMGVENEGQGIDLLSLTCIHDIVHEIPRIIVAIEQYNKFSKLARTGIIHHEAARVILHGSLEFRIFRIPEECRQIALVKGLDLSVLDRALNNISAAVMNMEATRLLIKYDLIDSQLQFALEMTHPPADSREGWKSLKGHRPSRFIFLTSLLKQILLVQPLLSLPRSKKFSAERQVMLNSKMEKFIEYLDNYELNKLVEVANGIAGNTTDDTHNNVDTAFLHAMTLA